MDELNRYELMLEAMAELKPEIDSARLPQGTQPTAAQPPLVELLAEFGPMPIEAMFPARPRR